MLAVLRILFGMIFVVSGFEKLVSPYQNFLYVIQGYQIVPAGLDVIVAQVFPWIELLIGLFIVLGLWVRWSLIGGMGMVLTFLTIVGQALIRKLPIDECGCFGELISFPPQVVFMIDSALLICAIVLLKRLDKSSRFSLDRYFND